MKRASTPPAHFDALYASRGDPWNLASSPYEDAKYRTTVAQLGRRRFRSGVELGCSIGVLTVRLADACDALLGVDCADQALAQARRRCAGLPHVRFANMILPEQWPDGTFDLIVLSEILYFWDALDIARAARRTVGSLEPGGLLLTVNWRGPNDGALPGDTAAEHFLGALPDDWERAESHAFDAYRIDGAWRPATPAPTTPAPTTPAPTTRA